MCDDGVERRASWALEGMLNLVPEEVRSRETVIIIQTRDDRDLK